MVDRMSESLILVSVRCPLRIPGIRVLHRAIELQEQAEGGHLFVLHVNRHHRGERIDREELACAVRKEVGPLDDASYHVRSAFLLEEAILYEAIQQEADYVVIGKTTKARWRRILSSRLGLNLDVESFLRRHLETNLVVV